MQQRFQELKTTFKNQRDFDRFIDSLYRYHLIDPNVSSENYETFLQKHNLSNESIETLKKLKPFISQAPRKLNNLKQRLVAFSLLQRISGDKEKVNDILNFYDTSNFDIPLNQMSLIKYIKEDNPLNDDDFLTYKYEIKELQRKLKFLQNEREYFMFQLRDMYYEYPTYMEAIPKIDLSLDAKHMLVRMGFSSEELELLKKEVVSDTPTNMRDSPKMKLMKRIIDKFKQNEAAFIFPPHIGDLVEEAPLQSNEKSIYVLSDDGYEKKMISERRSFYIFLKLLSQNFEKENMEEFYGAYTFLALLARESDARVLQKALIDLINRGIFDDDNFWTLLRRNLYKTTKWLKKRFERDPVNP